MARGDNWNICFKRTIGNIQNPVLRHRKKRNFCRCPAPISTASFVRCCAAVFISTYKNPSCPKGPYSLPPLGFLRRNKFESGAPVQPEAPEKKIFGRAPPLFRSKSTISRFGEGFRDGQYSLASFLFAVLLLTVSPMPSHLQKWGGGTCPSCPMESAPLVLWCCFLCDLYLMFALRPLWHLIFLLSPRYKCASI